MSGGDAPGAGAEIALDTSAVRVSSLAGCCSPGGSMSLLCEVLLNALVAWGMCPRVLPRAAEPGVGSEVRVEECGQLRFRQRAHLHHFHVAALEQHQRRD